MHVRKVTIVLVVLLLSLVAGAAMAQTNLPPITLNCEAPADMVEEIAFGLAQEAKWTAERRKFDGK